MTRLGIDIDGCLASFNPAYAKLLAEINGKDLLEGVVEANRYPCWDWDKWWKYDESIIKKAWDHIKRSDRFWEDLEPMPRAIATIDQLDGLAYEGYEVYFITNRPGYKAKYQTEAWLMEMGMMEPTVIVTADKEPIIRTLGINLFIDDKLETCRYVSKMAEYYALPTRVKVYIMDALYNRQGRFPSDGRVVASVEEMLRLEGLWKDK